MSLDQSATWPPGRPEIPGPWNPPERPAPQPILPSWLEPQAISLERELADRLLEQRVIVVGGRLDDLVASQVSAQLLLLDSQSSDPITMHLSCADAELDPSLALAAAIDLVGSPVHAVVRGTLRGPAIAVLCAAQERAAHRHTTFVLSSPQFAGEGKVAELATLADQHAHQVERLSDLIVRATGRSADEVAADLEPGRVLGAEEAKDYGLVDRLV